jgi:hypothetical protein
MFITVLRNENVMKLSDMNNERGIREKEHMSGDLEKSAYSSLLLLRKKRLS